MAEECKQSSEVHAKLDSQLSSIKLTINSQLVIQHDYLIKMANAIIYEDTWVAMECIQIIEKNQNTYQFVSNPFPMK